jgi:hypothetical protein
MTDRATDRATLDAVLDRLGWESEELAAWSHRTVAECRHMRRGWAPVDARLLDWLNRLAAAHDLLRELDRADRSCRPALDTINALMARPPRPQRRTRHGLGGDDAAPGAVVSRGSRVWAGGRGL